MTTILLNTVTGKAQICVLYNVWTIRVTYGWLGVHYTIYCLKCGGSVGDNTQGYVVNLYVSSFLYGYQYSELPYLVSIICQFVKLEVI